MSKRTRQYIALLCALAAYYLIHEGSHLLYALCIGTFRQINIMGLGVQIDVYADRITNTQMGGFCLIGSLAALTAGYGLTAASGWITRRRSAVFKACMYYTTLALLLVDPLYLSVLCGFFGGGDMNGISLLAPETAARIGYGVLLAANGLLFAKVVYPRYKQTFAGNS